MKKFKHYKNKKRSGFGFAFDLKIKFVIKALHNFNNTLSAINNSLSEYIKNKGL